MRGILVFAVLIVLFTRSASAATHYVRADASGSGSGADWTNACTDLFAAGSGCATLVDGDTYYVAKGSYGSHTYRKSAGAAATKIRRATSGDHGSATDWQAGYEGQAVWGYPQTFRSGSWEFDGATSTHGVEGSYGFKILPGSCSSNFNYPLSIGSARGEAVSYSRFAHIEVTLCGGASGTSQTCVYQGWDGSSSNNNTYSRIYCANALRSVYFAGSNSNELIEYLYSTGQWTGTLHGESMAISNSEGMTIRYSIFDGCAGTACIATQIGSAVGINNASIYGNVFYDDAVGNGVISQNNSYAIANSRIFNNTFARIRTRWFQECKNECLTSPSSDCRVPDGNCSVGTGNILKNNIIWNGQCSTPFSGTSTSVREFNSYLSCKDTAPSEPNSEVAAYDPFGNSGGDNFSIIRSTAPGTTLPSPYNQDPRQSVRGADSNWDRGAFEYSAGGSTAPSAPAGLRVE